MSTGDEHAGGPPALQSNQIMKPAPKSREGHQFEGILKLSMGAGFE
jgi:hypothetical protein